MRSSAFGLTACALLLAPVLLPDRAAATPPPPPFRGVDGPVRYCGDSFAISVRENEAVAYRQGWITFPSHEFRTGWKQISINNFTASQLRNFQPYREYAAGDGVEVEVEGAGTLIRVPLHYDEIGLNIRFDYAYISPPDAETGKAGVIVLSENFVGDERDLPLLARVEIGAMETLGCEAPSAETAEFYAEANTHIFGLRPQIFAGPLFLCGRRFGMPIGDGETARLSWRRGAAIVVDSGENTIRLTGGSWDRAEEPRLGPMVADYRIDIEFDFDVRNSPPRWRRYTFFRTDTDGVGRATMRFTGAPMSSADTAFLRRLEVIAENDERCFDPYPEEVE